METAKAMNTEIPLDTTDLEILTSLEKGGTKVSTTQLSDELSIPGRTIRYRMNRMRKDGLLKPPVIQTYERKLGLGERIVLIQSVPEKEDVLIKIIEELNLFYTFSTTYGRYDGFLIYTMFPLVNPRFINQIVDELREKGLIRDYFIFDAVDYTRKSPAITPFLPGEDWSWSTWVEETEEILKKDCENKLNLEEFPKVVKFDYSDVQILKYMVENPEPTLKEISKILKLSLTQVHKRVKRLEDTGVIKGIKPVFTPYKDCVSISCFFKSREHAQKIICGFHNLPFDLNFAMESPTKFNVKVSIPQTEMNAFLKHINIFRKYSEEFFIQICVKWTMKGYHHLLEAYNKETESWEIPINDVMTTIRKYAK
ncbi:MAG: winged helix-turn-helix transcriptional regulator [Candidatus Thorarchaeota archaeon]